MFKKGIFERKWSFQAQNWQFSNRNRYFFQITVVLSAILLKKTYSTVKIDIFELKLVIFELKMARFDELWRNWHKISDSTVTKRDKSQREMMLISYQSYPKMTKNDSKTQNSNQSLDKIEFIFKALKIHSQIEHVSS